MMAGQTATIGDPYMATFVMEFLSDVASHSQVLCAGEGPWCKRTGRSLDWYASIDGPRSAATDGEKDGCVYDDVKGSLTDQPAISDIFKLATQLSNRRIHVELSATSILFRRTAR